MNDINDQHRDTPSGSTLRQHNPTESALPQFRLMLSEAEELLQVQKRVRELLGSSSGWQQEGFGSLLDRVLPREPTREARVAHALDLQRQVLTALRSCQIDPVDVPLGELAVLGRALQLDYPVCWQLLQDDHMRIAAKTPGLRARTDHRLGEIQDRFKAAWERDALDDATEF